MEVKKTIFGAIACPHCGYELHPSEVYMPDDLAGKPQLIVRDPLGKLMYADYEEGMEPNLIQDFECPHCGRGFRVKAKVDYSTEALPEEDDFAEEAVSLL